MRDAVRQLLGGEVGVRRFVAVSHDVDGAEGAAGADGIAALTFTTDLGDPVPGYWIAPARPNAPALLYCHAHGGRYDIGREELVAGRPALLSPLATVLRDAGFGVLCLEMPCFGARAGMDENATAKARLWHGRTLFGQMLAEQVAGFDWLAAHPDVDPARIGAMGISMGGTLAWWLAVIEPRLACAVSMCCFSDMGLLIDSGAHDGHGNYMTVPGLLALGRTGQVAGLAAPCPMLHCVGLADWSTPGAAFARARDDLAHAYAAAGAAEVLHFHVEPGVGHRETAAMRARVMAFLSATLRPGAAQN